MEASEGPSSVRPGEDDPTIPLADSDPLALIDDDSNASPGGLESECQLSGSQTLSDTSTQRTRQPESDIHSLPWPEAGNDLGEQPKSSLWLNDCESLDSIPGTLGDLSRCLGNNPAYRSDTSLPGLLDGLSSVETISQQMARELSLDVDVSPDEVEERARLISQVLELQNTLEDLTTRVDSIKEENLKLRSENSILGQYIENLMQASAVFQPASSRPSGPPCQGGGPPPCSLGTVIRCTAKAVAGSKLLTPSSSSASSTPSDRTKSSVASTSTSGISPIF